MGINGALDLLCRFDEMGIGEVGVACRRTMPPVVGQLSHKRQVFARHDGVAGCRVAQVVQVEPAELGILADRPPAGREGAGAPAFGMAREQEGVRVAGAEQRLDERPRGLAERTDNPTGARGKA